MESAQRELLSVLLGRVLSLGLISKTTYQNAADSVHSVIDLPELLRYPVCRAREAITVECTQNTL